VLSAANAPELPGYQGSVLVDRTGRFVGDEVAAVAAETEESAVDALRWVDVADEARPVVGDLETALRPAAPHIYAAGNSAGAPQGDQRGDPAAGLQEAEVIIDAVSTTQTALHNGLEPHGCPVAWAGDHLTLWDSTQSVCAVRAQVAAKLGRPEHHVRLIKQEMGGGFGSQQTAWTQTGMAALLSRACGRPVQLMLDRAAAHLAVGNRHATRQRIRLGAGRDGTLTARSVRMDQAVGASLVGGEGSHVSGTSQRRYRCANLHPAQVPVSTNTGPAVAFRAPGDVEGALALASALDELARAWQRDPLALRLRNDAEADQRRGGPYTTPDRWRRCDERATAGCGWRH
jgi:xanthine dehydrogenase YagR molybdenum-binding subunit